MKFASVSFTSSREQTVFFLSHPRGKIIESSNLSLFNCSLAWLLTRSLTRFCVLFINMKLRGINYPFGIFSSLPCRARSALDYAFVLVEFRFPVMQDYLLVCKHTLNQFSTKSVQLDCCQQFPPISSLNSCKPERNL